MVQLAPEAMLIVQLFAKSKEDAFVPVSAILMMDSVDPPELVKVTLCEPLMVPAWAVNDRLVDDSETAGGIPPVPVSVMVCGDPTP